MDKLTFIVLDASPYVGGDQLGEVLENISELVLIIGVVVGFFAFAVIQIRKIKKKSEEKNMNNKDSEE